MGEANGTDPTEEISAAMVGLNADFYDHERTTATTYINDNVVDCVLEDILSVAEGELIAEGDRAPSKTGESPSRRGPRTSSRRQSSASRGRRVTAFMSANQTAPGVACELFFLEPLVEAA